MVAKPSPWLDGSGRHAESVLSSRVRLARNLEGLRFAHRADQHSQEKSLDLARSAVLESSTLGTGDLMLISQLSELDRQFLVERHLISQEHSDPSPGRAVVVGGNEMVSIMLNEEDHLRLQSIFSGFEVMEAWRLVDRVDSEIDEQLDYAFSYEWGYLTACPTNTGTGLRASMLVHLPALVLTQQINKVLHGITQMGLAVRGFYGEGSEVMGNLFQISNRTTLGLSEIDVIQGLEKVVRQVLEYEAQARENLLRNAPSRIEDKVWRAYGILKYARRVSTKEVMSLTSAVRLGLCLEMIDDVSVAGLNGMIFMSQPAHLQRRCGREMAPEERDVERAEMVRRILSGKEAPG
jgi:protein arginine kinase